MQIDMTDETGELDDATLEIVQKVVSYAMKKENIGPLAELSISFVTNETITSLNKQYRQMNEPTDVLSFPLADTLQANDHMPIILGDIIVSIDKVKEQANEYNHTFKRELLFLIIHGLLHLLGYAHDTEAEEKMMFQKQENILKEFNIERK